MSELFNEMALTPGWVWAVGLAVVVGGIVFYFRDKKKRFKEYEDAK